VADALRQQEPGAGRNLVLGSSAAIAIHLSQAQGREHGFEFGQSAVALDLRQIVDGYPWLPPVTGQLLGIALAERVQHHLHPCGNTKPIEDSKDIVLDRVFAQFKAGGNLTIGEPFGDATHDVLLTLGKQDGAAGISETSRGGIGEGFQHVTHFNVIGPHLSAVYHANALPQGLNRLSATEYAPGAGTKSCEHRLFFGTLDQQDGFALWEVGACLTAQLQAFHRLLVQVHPDDSHIRPGGMQRGEGFLAAGTNANDFKLGITLHGISQQLTAHAGTVGHQDTNRGWAGRRVWYCHDTVLRLENSSLGGGE